PNYKQLLDMSNATLLAMGKSMMNMGLNIPLVWNELAHAYENSAKGILQDTGISIEGDDVKSISEDFAKKLKEVGFCQRVNLLEVNDEKIKIDIGECIFAAATKKFRGNDLNFIPPCPMVAILYGAIEKNIGKKGYVEKAQWKPEENTTIFDIKLE
ncbi:MAG: hypothetical protein P8Y70_05995, partial [Candidatus Lokiarchaeota archaeon]